MSKRRKIELRLLITVLSIINRFFCTYSLRISSTNSRIDSYLQISAIDDPEIIDNPAIYLRLGVTDFIKINRAIRQGEAPLRYISHHLVFKQEVVYKTDDKNEKNPARYFICFEKQRDGEWLVKVLSEDFINANSHKYKTACTIRQ